ncbi:MAG: glutamate mutase L [Anaerolineae bacterium]|nr:glutamate mutase L [Anaerolineae bacterium]
MADETGGGTYLLIDVGHVLTHVAYIAPVEGVARLVALAEASTTNVLANGGLMEGVRRAIANLHVLVGRQMLEPNGELRRPGDGDGHGVDGVVLTTSLAPTLRVAVVGLTRDLSLASAIRAATLPYVTLVRTICLENSTRRWETEDLQALVGDPPDVVVMAGGVDGGPVAPIRDMGEILSAAYSLLPESARPVVVFAGNARAHRSLIAAFSGITDLRLVANVRPTAQSENLEELRATLTRLFYARGVSQAAELQSLSRWAQAPILSDLDAMARTLRFLARRYSLEKGLLGVDVGGNGSRVLLVRPQGGALAWASPYGCGTAVAALRDLGDPTAVMRWMHHPLSWAEVWDRLSNVEVRPAGVPQTEEDWDLQQASARESLWRTWRGALAAWGQVREDGVCWDADVVVARGSVLNRARTPGRAALMLIDALQLTGLVRLTLDWANLLPGLSGLARTDALAAVQVLDSDGLMDLGTLVAPAGSGRPGTEALRARLFEQGELRAEVSVPAGSIRTLPLGVNEIAQLELYPARGFDLGGGRRGRAGVAEVRGGALGVILDARGRPLQLPTDEEERARALQTWEQEIDAG